jgi:heme-degrading monooxygenase HmoA
MNPNSIAKTPEPPYYAVIFTSLRTEGDRGYGHMAERMFELAAQQPGFLGVESAHTADGLGITVSYWASEEAIAAWRRRPTTRLLRRPGSKFGVPITIFVWPEWSEIMASAPPNALQRTGASSCVLPPWSFESCSCAPRSRLSRSLGQ